MGLGSVELVLAFEEAFGIELNDDEVVETLTPRKIGDLIYSKLQNDNQVSWTRKKVSALIKRITIEMHDISEDVYHDDAHFIHDMGIDQ
ncbi:acyl carrier protein [bacterium]